jgi:lipopolysaccharide/colanic/teichoic acid biosynthesis glycosyltransferase
MDVDVFIVPRLFELHNSDRNTDDIWGVPLVRVRRAAFRTRGWQVKRLIDVVISATALVLLSPVLVACATAVRIEGGPGIIFRQTRVGLDGRPFDLLKFRSLKPAGITESQTHWNIQHDSRLGPVGRFCGARRWTSSPSCGTSCRVR